ncbi:MAG: DNA polymerase III subunit delta [bacterium]
MLIFLYGPDTYRSIEKLKEFKNKFLRDVEGGSLNLTEIDGEKITFGDFKKEISTVSFMARKRMIILRSIIKSKKKELQKEIVEYLKLTVEKDEDNILIFYEEDASAKEPLVKFLAGGGKNKSGVLRQEFPLLKGADLRNWIIKAVKEKGANIDMPAVNMLMERIGSDLWQMNNELEKLACYDKNITCENIKKFVKTKDDENIFNLTDAIGGKNKKLALKLLTEELRAGVNINYILTMLARQYRLLLETQDYVEKSGGGYINSAAVARDLKLHPYVAQKLSTQVKMYKYDDLKNLYGEIMRIDFKSKTSSVNIELLLDMMIAGEKL